MEPRAPSFPAELKTFLQRWLITTLAVLVTANVLSGIQYDSPSGLLAATLLLGLLNAFVRPVLMLLSLPLLILSLGLFTVIINALLLYGVGQLKFFHVDSFWTAVKGALLISILSMVLGIATGVAKPKVRMRMKRSRPSPRDGGPGDGPVIDV